MGQLAPSAVVDVHRVVHPPSWRGESFHVDFVLLDRPYFETDLTEIYKWAICSGLKNPRAISPQTHSWSSVFQPRFFKALRHISTAESVPEMRCRDPNDGLDNLEGRVRFWMQSVVFLASVTLSAAIVQSRASQGTIESKYDKLWQVGILERLGYFPELADANICSLVTDLARRSSETRTKRLLDVREVFEFVVERLAAYTPAQRVCMEKIADSDPRMARFGFVDELRDRLPQLRAVIVYGSSISSDNFSDYDIVIVVDNAVAALQELEDSSPHWRGKELNIGIYTPRELWSMQLLSGDNLASYGLCLFGDVELPEKQKSLLMARNLSFGMVRLRQQLGMIGNALMHPDSIGDDRRNLYNYFLKIAANVAKGTFGADGHHWSKEDVHKWLREGGGQNAEKEAKWISRHGPVAHLAAAAGSTENTLQRLNEQFQILSAV